jgi:hypothetical protein
MSSGPPALSFPTGYFSIQAVSISRMYPEVLHLQLAVVHSDYGSSRLMGTLNSVASVKSGLSRKYTRAGYPGILCFGNVT